MSGGSGAKADEIRPLEGLPLDYSTVNPAQALADAERLHSAWNTLIMRTPGAIALNDSESAADRDYKWREASVRIGMRFVSALHRADPLLREKPKGNWDPYFGVTVLEPLYRENDVDSAVERRLLNEYLKARYDCQLIETLGSAGAGIAEDSYDLFIYWAMQHIAEVSAYTRHHEHLLLGATMISHLGRRAREASEIRDKRNFELRDSVFRSVVITHELAMLARRSEAVVSRYGEKQVEVRLEQQLSLLFQSFGFYIVGANRGQPQVDLIAIAPAHGGESFSILVEAKSTRNSYSLPTKDLRALSEYIYGSQKLTTLPRLRVVLLVGPEPTKTIRAKLQALQAETAIPVRYCEAQYLGWLRDSCPGPLPLHDFLKALLECDYVVDLRTLRIVGDIDRQGRSAHRDFVNALTANHNSL